MHRAHGTRLAVLAVLVLPGSGGCGEGAPGTSDCSAALEGRSFKGPLDECGMCPCGLTAGCDWTVSFVDGAMDWRYSDTGVHAPVVCSDGEIRDAWTGEHYGTHDAEHDVVELGGDHYYPCDGSCQIDLYACDQVCADPCDLLVGHGFRSASPQECGLCPDGSALPCLWVLTFEDEQYRWSYSDVTADGTYLCDAGELTTAEGYSGAYRYDLMNPAGSTLDWEGLTYEACAGACDPGHGQCP